MSKKKIVLMAVAVIIIVLLGWLLYLGAGTKQNVCSGANLNRVIPITIAATFYQVGYDINWQLPQEYAAVCAETTTDYLPCISAMLAPKLGEASTAGLVSEIKEKCTAAQQKIQAFTSAACTANEMVVGIDVLSTLLTPEACEYITTPYEPGPLRLCGERTGSPLNLFGEKEAREALLYCMNAIDDYRQQIPNPYD